MISADSLEVFVKEFQQNQMRKWMQHVRDHQQKRRRLLPRTPRRCRSRCRKCCRTRRRNRIAKPEASVRQTSMVDAEGVDEDEREEQGIHPTAHNDFILHQGQTTNVHSVSAYFSEFSGIYKQIGRIRMTVPESVAVQAIQKWISTASSSAQVLWGCFQIHS